MQVRNVSPGTMMAGLRSRRCYFVATVHSEMSKPKKKKLQVILRSCFTLDDFAVAQLIDEAIKIDCVSVDLFQCARQLNEKLDDQGRRHIVKMMWEVMCADGRENALEDNIIWRAADLLGLSSRQRVELRHGFQLAAPPSLLAIIFSYRTHRRQLSVTKSNLPIDSSEIPRLRTSRRRIANDVTMRVSFRKINSSASTT